MANKYVTANNKLVVVDGKLLQVSGDNVDDELLNLIDTQTTSLGTTELSVSELDTLIDNHIVDGVTLDSSVLLIDSPSNNSVEIKDIRVSNIDVAFITLNTTNGHIDLYGSGNDVTLYQDTTLTYESGNITTDNLVAENIKKDVNILGVVGTHEGGGSLNVAYSLTPPTDTSKIWLQCAEPSGVEVQNYLGECAVSSVANWGGISNPVSSTNAFNYSTSYNGDGAFFTSCYIGNNQIAIVGYNHIRIYDLTTKLYIADYTISVGTSYGYTNVIYKDNLLYFAYNTELYSFDLTTQTLTKLCNFGSYYNAKYIFFNGDNYIDALTYYSYSSSHYSSHYRYDLVNNTKTRIYELNYDTHFRYIAGNIIKANDTIYNFGLHTANNGNYWWTYNITSHSLNVFTSFKTFMESLGWTLYSGSSVIYDNERFIYLIGGFGTYNGTASTNSNLIIRYDIINDTFELLDQKLISAKKYHYSLLIDNRVYIFGGQDDRKNNLDYFDLSYPLTQNNAIITTNTINTDNALPLINTEKLKINSNIASAYLGNANNLAEKVNAYYYQSQKSNDTYSSVTFDKNTIISNFENITNAINSNGGALVCSFGGDSENANYTLMISTSDVGIAVIVMKVNENVMIGNIGSDGTLYESFGATPCTWLDGNTNTFAFDNSYELNTVIDGGLPLSTPQELIDLGICTFVINQGNEIG